MKISIINDEDSELVLEVNNCTINHNVVELHYEDEQKLRENVAKLKSFNLPLYKNKTKRYFVDYSAKCLYIYNNLITIKN